MASGKKPNLKNDVTVWGIFVWLLNLFLGKC